MACFFTDFLNSSNFLRGAQPKVNVICTQFIQQFSKCPCVYKLFKWKLDIKPVLTSTMQYLSFISVFCLIRKYIYISSNIFRIIYKLLWDERSKHLHIYLPILYCLFLFNYFTFMQIWFCLTDQVSSYSSLYRFCWTSIGDHL